MRLEVLLGVCQSVPISDNVVRQMVINIPWVFSTAPGQSPLRPSYSAAARAALLSLLMAGAAAAEPPSAVVKEVTVTGRRPIVVTATDWCPTPDPARHPADQPPRVVDAYPR